MIKIGDTVIPKRCSTEYQTANKMTVKYIKMSRFNTICDGENMVGKSLGELGGNPSIHLLGGLF